HPGDAGEHARGHTAAVADHQCPGCAGARRRRREAEQDLGVHVAVVGSVGLAVDLERAPGAALPHGDSRVPPLLESELVYAPMRRVRSVPSITTRTNPVSTAPAMLPSVLSA